MRNQPNNKQRNSAALMALLVAYVALVVGLRLDGTIPAWPWTYLLMPVWLPVFSAIVLAVVFFAAALVLVLVQIALETLRGGK